MRIQRKRSVIMLVAASNGDCSSPHTCLPSDACHAPHTWLGYALAQEGSYHIQSTKENGK